MSPAVLGAALTGMVAAVAAVGAVWALQPAGSRPSLPVGPPRRLPDRLGTRVGLGLAAALLVLLATRWPVATALAAAGGFAAPGAARGTRRRRSSLARIDAVATWTEMLRDVLGSGSGLAQAVLITAEVAPHAIEDELRRLAARAGRGEDMVASLRSFAAELDDPVADKVVAALILASRRSAGELGDLLSTLAEVSRDNAAMLRKVDAGRARVRSSMRLITGFTVAFSLVFVLADRDYVEAYQSFTGQLVLCAVAGLFVAAHTWTLRATGERQPDGLLGGVDPDAAAAHHAEPPWWGGRQ
ncbi:MAG: type II secretion system F family protein [Actinomycetota bacterium]